MRRDGLNDQEPLIPVFNPRPYGDIYTVRLADGHVDQLTHNKWDDGTPPGCPRSDFTPAAVGDILLPLCPAGSRTAPGRGLFPTGGDFKPTPGRAIA